MTISKIQCISCLRTQSSRCTRTFRQSRIFGVAVSLPDPAVIFFVSVQTYTYTYVRTHACIHTRAYTHACIYACVYASYTFACIHTHACIYACVHASYTFAYIHTHACIHTFAPTHTYIHTYMRACIEFTLNERG